MDCFEMGVIQITGSCLFICPSIADFGLEIGKFISIRQIEFVLENRCAGIAIVIGNGVIYRAR